MGDQYIPAFSTLTNDITVVSFHYVITKESPCTVSAGAINPDTVALSFCCLWLWKHTARAGHSLGTKHDNRRSKAEQNDVIYLQVIYLTTLHQQHRFVRQILYCNKS